jgi:hypothetical protein
MCETRDFFSWGCLTFLRVCDSVRAKITSPQHILTNEINHAYMFFKPFIFNLLNTLPSVFGVTSEQL